MRAVAAEQRRRAGARSRWCGWRERFGRAGHPARRDHQDRPHPPDPRPPGRCRPRRSSAIRSTATSRSTRRWRAARAARHPLRAHVPACPAAVASTIRRSGEPIDAGGAAAGGLRRLLQALSPAATTASHDSPRRFDLIVFDWDGTLFDSTALIARCIQAACADLGTAVPSDRDASYVIGLGLADALAPCGARRCRRERYGELGRALPPPLLRQPGRDRRCSTARSRCCSALKARNHRLGVATGKTRRGLDDALRPLAAARRCSTPPAPPTRPPASPIR